jgi:hypothetical protein
VLKRLSSYVDSQAPSPQVVLWRRKLLESQEFKRMRWKILFVIPAVYIVLSIIYVWENPEKLFLPAEEIGQALRQEDLRWRQEGIHHEALQRLVYFQDKRTSICFAVTWIGMISRSPGLATVDCAIVMPFLLE